MTHYTDNLSQLGAQTAAPTSPETAVLERVPNPHADTLYLARFTAPEFTSLCPVTGQPDFAHIVIDYAPGDWLVESKSLKLYLTSFRNHGAFHEDCTVAIGRRLADLLAPKWLRIGGYWYPRGGIPIDVFWQDGRPARGAVAARPGRADLSRAGVRGGACSLRTMLPYWNETVFRIALLSLGRHYPVRRQRLEIPKVPPLLSGSIKLGQLPFRLLPSARDDEQ